MWLEACKVTCVCMCDLQLVLKCWDWVTEQEPDGAQHGFNPRGETVQNHDVDRAITIELELTELNWICQYPTQAEVTSYVIYDKAF